MQQLLQSQLAGFNPAQLQQLMQQQQQILSHHQVKRLKDIWYIDKYLLKLTFKNGIKMTLSVCFKGEPF